MAGTIHYSDDGSTSTITIDNSEKRNALSITMLEKLRERLEKISNNESKRVVVLRGAGEKAFSAGLDVNEFVEGKTLKSERQLAKTLRALEELDIPTIAMVNGDAIGGGFELVIACDLRYAVEEARFGITPARIGIIPSDRAIKQIVESIGPSYAKELLFTGELISAGRAVETGVVNQVTDQENLETRVAAVADTIASNSPLAVSGMKSIIATITNKRQLTPTEKRWANHIQLETIRSADHQEGLQAFQENRNPEFEGQ